MKKVLIGLLLLIGLCSCNESRCYSSKMEDTDFLVEEKYMTWNGWYSLVISDLETKSTRTIQFGQYTYESTNPGDTITIKNNW